MRDADKIVETLLESDEVDPKDFLDDRDIRTANTTVTIAGSYGSFTADRETGLILHREIFDTAEDFYSDITRFDMAELRDWIEKNAPHEQVEDGEHLDIVDVGFWVKDTDSETEDYVPAEEEHRGVVYLGHAP